MYDFLSALAFLLIVAAPVLAVIALNGRLGPIAEATAEPKRLPADRLEAQMEDGRIARARYLRSLLRSAKPV
jgi:hypothetical protein